MMRLTRPTASNVNRGHDQQEVSVTLEYQYDPQTFGFAFYWNGPMEGVHHFDSHQITVVFGPFIIGIEWSK